MTQPSTKAALRADTLARRDMLTTADREVASAAIAERAFALLETARPRVLAAYLPIWSEVDPRPIIARALQSDIAVVLPALIDSTTMVFRTYRSGEPLVDGGFGTRAPGPNAAIAEPNVMISPMIAFDRTGTRLGHGLGHYDRAIARLRAEGHKPLLIGLAFATQEVPAIPAEAHDVRMDWIVTEKEALEFQR